MSKITIKPFDQLSLDELYAIMRLRQEVFVVEQDCAYLDADGKDQPAHHVMLWDGTALAGTTRLLPAGTSYAAYTSIGRVANPLSHRGRGLGKAIMQASIEWLATTHPNYDIKISAQCYLDRFYSDLGFVATGETYLEDGIPHQAMIYPLQSLGG